ncbi:MAG: thioesterase family protein [Arenicellales bacterium]
MKEPEMASDNPSGEISSDALLDAARVFEERIPFNRVLGLRVESLDGSDVAVRFDMRDELVGNFTRGNLHGGVISSVLDVVGGLVAFLALLKREGVTSLEDEAEKFSKLGTIDLRVDYLRPGIGEIFCAKGFVLRAGRKVAVTRMELHNEADSLIAVGTGAYSIS